MSLGTGVFLVLVGLILEYAITVERVWVVNLQQLGAILVFIGLVVIVLSLVWLVFAAIFRRRRAGPRL